MAKGRHRRPPPGSKPKPAAGAADITGKRASQAKNQRYARPLPLTVKAADPEGKQPQKQTWGQWAASWLSVLGSGSSTSSAQGEDPLVGYFDHNTCSVWVQVTPPQLQQSSEAGPSTQTHTARVLWDAGFFGKGSLSRSEPTWRMRKINEERVKKQREMGIKVYTPEELTALRRRERMQAKIERARLAVKAGQQLPDGIVALGGSLTEEEEKLLERKAQTEVEQEDEEGEEAEQAYGQHIPGLIYLAPKKDEQDGGTAPTAQELEDLRRESATDIVVEDVEWLHLSGAEVFFLAGMLGVLEVRDQDDSLMSLQVIYEQLLASHLPPLLRQSPIPAELCRPDNPFLISYIAYHHYRSLGWTVKSGIKFCADWLLYKRGPVFGHAEFAILVIPVYEDPEDEKTSPFPPHPAGGDRDWVWFSTMNRVQTQVLKTLVLTHVTIPPLSRTPPESTGTPEALVEGLKAGRLHTVKEVSLRRWVPARMRG